MNIAEALRDAYTFKKECVVGGEDELQYTVWLKVGNQSFSLDGYHNEEEAEYFRLMLGKAIQVILSEHAPKSDSGSGSPKPATNSVENGSKLVVSPAAAEGLLKDRERLDWLERQVHNHRNCFSFAKYSNKPGDGLDIDKVTPETTFRSAIDAAGEAEQKLEGKDAR